MERNTKSSVKIHLHSEDSGVKFLEINSQQRKKTCMCGRKKLTKYKTKLILKELKKYTESKEFEPFFTKNREMKISRKSLKQGTMGGENFSDVSMKQSNWSLHFPRNYLTGVKRSAPQKQRDINAWDASTIDLISSQHCRRKSSPELKSSMLSFIEPTDNGTHKTCSVPCGENNYNWPMNHSLWKYLNSDLRRSLENHSYDTQEKLKETKQTINKISSEVNSSLLHPAFPENNIALYCTNEDALLSNEMLSAKILIPNTSKMLSYDNNLNLKVHTKNVSGIAESETPIESCRPDKSVQLLLSPSKAAFFNATRNRKIVNRRDHRSVFEVDDNTVSNFKYLSSRNTTIYVNIPITAITNLYFRKSNLDLFLRNTLISSPIVSKWNELLEPSGMTSKPEKSFKCKISLISNTMQHCTLLQTLCVQVNALKENDELRHVDQGLFKYNEICSYRPLKEICYEEKSFEDSDPSNSLQNNDQLLTTRKEKHSRAHGNVVLNGSNPKLNYNKLFSDDKENIKNVKRFSRISKKPNTFKDSNYLPKRLRQQKIKNKGERNTLEKLKFPSLPRKRQSKEADTRLTSQNETQACENLVYSRGVNKEYHRYFTIGNKVWKHAFKSAEIAIKSNRKRKLSKPETWVTDRLYRFLLPKFEKKFSSFVFVQECDNMVQDLCKNIRSTLHTKNDQSIYIERVMKQLYDVGIIKSVMDFLCFSKDYLPPTFETIVTQHLVDHQTRRDLSADINL